MNDKKLLGSQTAKGGFANEKTICAKFNNWKTDKEAKLWLENMGYPIEKLYSVEAVHVPVRISKTKIIDWGYTEQEYEDIIKYKKADAQISIKITIGAVVKIENISLKKANLNFGYNQIDKRSVTSYQEMWKFDDEIAFWLRLYSGELSPLEYIQTHKIHCLKDERRLFLNEMPKEIVIKILNFFEKHKFLVISDVLKGRGGLSANWILVTRYNTLESTTSWILKEINSTINYYCQGEVEVSKQGNLHIAKITMQRKGGTPDPTKLQFKFNPNELFELN